MKPSEKLYQKYEFLAKKYANKIFSYHEISFEYEDLLQEFRIKIFTSIKSYGRRWSKFRKGEAPRSVPIRYYLEAACCNKARDFIKYISRENHKVSIDEINYDFGVGNDNNVDPTANKFIVNGVDLLEGLSGKERAIFSLYLRGRNLTFLRKVYFSNSKEKESKRKVVESGDKPIDVKDIIEMQKEFLIKKYGSELMKSQQVYSSYSIDED
jgi:DNA-directed RNA polymerase specialized sigma24 family protein